MRTVIIMARLMRKTSVLIIVWIIGFYVYLYQNKTALFLSGYESDAHNEMYIGSHNVGDIDIRTDVDNTDAILQRIVASDAGNFSYVSSDNVGVLDPSRGRFTDVDNYLKNKVCVYLSACTFMPQQVGHPGYMADWLLSLTSNL